MKPEQDLNALILNTNIVNTYNTMDNPDLEEKFKIWINPEENTTINFDNYGDEESILKIGITYSFDANTDYLYIGQIVDGIDHKNWIFTSKFLITQFASNTLYDENNNPIIRFQSNDIEYHGQNLKAMVDVYKVNDISGRRLFTTDDPPEDLLKNGNEWYSVGNINDLSLTYGTHWYFKKGRSIQ